MQTGAIVDGEADMAVAQLTEVRYVPYRHEQAVPLPDQMRNSLDTASNPPLSEAVFVVRKGADDRAGEELPKAVAGGVTQDDVQRDFTAGDPDELVLPQLQEEIQTVLREATQAVLQNKSALLLPDAEKATALNAGPIKAEGKREKRAPPVQEGRVELRNFLAVGSFGVAPAPTPQETEGNNRSVRSAAAS